MNINCLQDKGFTLIEILITLVILSVGVMALGSFSLTTLSSGQTSRERLTAVHLAEQILEEWQQSGTLPVLSATNYCQTAVSWVSPNPLPNTTAPCPTTGTVNVSTASCIPLFGMKKNYTIEAKESPLCGPSASGSGSFVFYTSTPPAISPKTKVVTVTWTSKGKVKSVYLTHLSVVQ